MGGGKRIEKKEKKEKEEGEEEEIPAVKRLVEANSQLHPTWRFYKCE